MSTQQRVINQLKEDLSSSNDSVITKALTKTRAKGNEQLIDPLIELYTKTENQKIKEEIKSIFSELKNKDILDFLLPQLSEGSNEVKELIFFSIWSSGIDMTDHIPELIEASCSGDYMVILEALTVLENLEGPFNEDDLFQANTLLQQYLYESEDSKEKELIKSMYDIVLEFGEKY
jgi:HEAT repeat protein